MSRQTFGNIGKYERKKGTATGTEAVLLACKPLILLIIK